jgi:hypothetical protein
MLPALQQGGCMFSCQLHLFRCSPRQLYCWIVPVLGCHELLASRTTVAPVPQVVERTAGYSGSDMRDLIQVGCCEAARCSALQLAVYARLRCSIGPRVAAPALWNIPPLVPVGVLGVRQST